MSDPNKFIEVQRTHMDNHGSSQETRATQDSWFDESTVDFWRHDQMISTIDPLGKFYQNSKWLTVGDGRFGLDSVKLRKKYDLEVLPSDLSEKLLARSKELGHIQDYSVENIEQLSFGDDTFDVVFCKESFHHLPRPMIGLYEMLRVAAEAVVLIEPFNEERLFANSRGMHLKKALKIVSGYLKGKFINPYAQDEQNKLHAIPKDFEPTGNYVYGLSLKEINKIVHALGLGGFAYLGFNDAYIRGVEYEPAEPDNERFKELKNMIHELDQKGQFNCITTIIFKKEIPKDLMKELKNLGYVVPEITKNPFVKP